jgi:hypothetical protein
LDKVNKSAQKRAAQKRGKDMCALETLQSDGAWLTVKRNGVAKTFATTGDATRFAENDLYAQRGLFYRHKRGVWRIVAAI